MEILAKKASRLFVFTDLDDTLFESIGADIPDSSIPATIDNNGNVYSYSSIQQQKLLDIMIQAGGVIIPVTGRDSSSLLNCQLGPIITSKYAVVSHGAIVLNQHHLLLDDWYRFIDRKFGLTSWEQKLISLHEKLLADVFLLSESVRIRLVIDKGITCYICLKIKKENYNYDQSTQINNLLLRKLKKDMSLHHNGRGFAILPPYAKKKIAVDFLKEKMNITSNDTVVGIGDSYSDLPFMSNSDFLISPKRSQIFTNQEVI